MEEQYYCEYSYTSNTARRSSKGSECFTQAHADAISPQIVSGFDYYPGSPELSDGPGKERIEGKRPPDRWCCWCLLVLLLLAALAAAAAFTVLSVLENPEDRTETTITMRMTFLNAEYDDRLADESSPIFADSEDKYCSAVKELADSGDQISDFECRVLKFSPGSLRVTFHLTFDRDMSQGDITQALRSGIQNNNSTIVMDGDNIVVSDFTISEISVTSKRPNEGRANQGLGKEKEEKVVSVSKRVTVVYEPSKSVAAEVSQDALRHVVEFALSLSGVEVVFEDKGTKRSQDQIVITLSTSVSNLEESRSCSEMKYLIETGVSQLVPTYLPGVEGHDVKLLRFLCSETKLTRNAKPKKVRSDEEDKLTLCEGRSDNERPYFCWELKHGSKNEGPTTTTKPPILCDEPEMWQKSSRSADCYRPWCSKDGVVVDKFDPSPVCCKAADYQHEGCRCVPNRWVTVDSCTRALCSSNRVLGDPEINPTEECCSNVKNEPNICAKWRQCEPNSWLPHTTDDIGSGAGELTKAPCHWKWCSENGQVETDKFRAADDCCILYKFNETSCHRGFCKGESWVQIKECEKAWCDSSRILQFSDTQFIPSEACCEEQQSHPECNSSCTPDTWIGPEGSDEYSCELDFCNSSGQIERSVTFPSFYCCYQIGVESARCKDPLCFPGTNVTEACYAKMCNNKGQYETGVFTPNEECCSSIDVRTPACEEYVNDTNCEPNTWVQQDSCQRSWCNEGGDLGASQFIASANCCSTVDGPLMGECLQFVSDECTPDTWINTTASRPSLAAVGAVSPQGPCYRSWCNPLGRIDNNTFFPSAQCCRLEGSTDPGCAQPLCEPYTWSNDECFGVLCNASGLPGLRQVVVNRECCERYQEDTVCTEVTWCDNPNTWVVVDRCFRARCEDTGQLGPVRLVPRAPTSCCEREEGRDIPSCRLFVRRDGEEGLTTA